MAGNVGVQSAAIVVQGLANNKLKSTNIFDQLIWFSLLLQLDNSRVVDLKP